MIQRLHSQVPQQVRRQEWKSAGSGSGASAFFTHGWHWHWSLVIRIGQWPLYTGVVVGFALLMIDLLQPVLPFLSKTLCCYHHHAVILFVNVPAVQCKFSFSVTVQPMCSGIGSGSGSAAKSVHCKRAILSSAHTCCLERLATSARTPRHSPCD